MERQSSAFSYEYIWEYTPESRNRENAGRARIPRLFIRRYVYSVNAIKYRPSRQGNKKGPENRRAAARLGAEADAFPDIRTRVNSGRERVLLDIQCYVYVVNVIRRAKPAPEERKDAAAAGPRP